MVETYFNQELSDITFEVEALEEWKQIAQSLGLQNQLELTKGKLSPVQYPFINEVMHRVYSTLCPRVVKLEEYKVTPIPLEVMRCIAQCANDNIFSRIEIWYDDKNADPLAVGITESYYGYVLDSEDREVIMRFENSKETFYGTEQEVRAEAQRRGLKCRHVWSSDKTLYLIARWGDELRDFATLKKIAIERFIENETGELQKKIAEFSQKLELIKENTVSYFNGNLTKYEATNSY